MPVRSLNSFVLVWPTRAEIDNAVRQWADRVAAIKPELCRLGYFGSYARGDWGVGSDLDVIAIVTTASERRDRRAISWDLTGLPVAAELLVFTIDEWRELETSRSRFASMLLTDTVWVR